MSAKMPSSKQSVPHPPAAVNPAGKKTKASPTTEALVHAVSRLASAQQESAKAEAPQAPTPAGTAAQADTAATEEWAATLSVQLRYAELLALDEIVSALRLKHGIRKFCSRSSVVRFAITKLALNAQSVEEYRAFLESDRMVAKSNGSPGGAG